MKTIKRQEGFTLVELMVTMVIFLFTIVAASNLFATVLGQFKQQSKIAETSIQGLVGFEMLRFDIEQAGYGIPFDYVSSINYEEALDDPNTQWDDDSDFINDAPGNPPRAITVYENQSWDPSSALALTKKADVLAIKAMNVAVNDAAHKWTYTTVFEKVVYPPVVWGSAEEDLADGDFVAVVKTGSEVNHRDLVVGTSGFFTTFKKGPPIGLNDDSFSPKVSDGLDARVIYGIKNASNIANEVPRMPFNRADYYIRRPATPGLMPSRCAPGTGILYKGVINNSQDAGGGGVHTEYPLVECVIDMQVVLAADQDRNGTIESYYKFWPAGTTAKDIREQLKEIRIYVLAHEGQIDPNYQFNNPTNADPASPAYDITDPQAFSLNITDLKDAVGANYRNYRWKLYTMVFIPYNLTW